MALAADLAALGQKFAATAPAQVVSAVNDTRAHMQSTFDSSKTIRVGDTFPAFTLTSATGEPVSTADLFAKGPTLVSFYRGSWCPLCNLELGAFQRRLTDFAAHGVTYVAISPELPDNSLSFIERAQLAFPVLTDQNLVLARQLGIVTTQLESMRPAQAALGTDLTARNGRDSMELPVPATFLVDGRGVVRERFVDADYTTRLEPDVALEWIEKMEREDGKA